jgi:hypothetical protein
MTVNGKRSSLTARDLENIAKKFSIKDWKNITSEVIEGLQSWQSIAKTAKVPEGMIEKIGGRIQVNTTRVKKDLVKGMDILVL